jgi:hypothetical protein
MACGKWKDMSEPETLLMRGRNVSQEVELMTWCMNVQLFSQYPLHRAVTLLTHIPHLVRRNGGFYPTTFITGTVLATRMDHDDSAKVDAC